MVDSALAQALVNDQFVRWSALSIEPVDSDGTDHVMFRLGSDLALRFPTSETAQEQGDKEYEWLARLSAQLPLEVPVAVGRGEPDRGFPFRWSVVEWVDGTNATAETLTDLSTTAETLAELVLKLWQVDPAGGPRPGAHNFWRGVPLHKRDGAVRSAIADAARLVDAKQVNRSWGECLTVPPSRTSAWIHGDLHPGNLIARDGRLIGVIDFGGMGVGDPACDLMVAWNLLDRTSREHFRRLLGVDDATWIRGRGWALSMAIIALPYYLESNPRFARACHHTLERVLED